MRARSVRGREAARWAAVLALLVSGAAVWHPARAAPAGQRAGIAAREFAFDPGAVTVQPGDVTFVVKNEGAIEHNFVVQDGAGKKVGEIPVIAPGASDEVTVTLQPGAYAMVCTLPGHKEAGMQGTITARP